MGSKTKISWTHGLDEKAGSTWNPVRGCSRVSSGCEHCYAERMAGRFCGEGMPYEGLVRIGKNGARWTGKVALVEDRLYDPLRWRRPRRIFVNSMSDLFHEQLSRAQIARVWAVMLLAPRHTFMVLTKRPARMREVLTDKRFYRDVLEAANPLRCMWPTLTQIGISDPALMPAPWIWLGVSTEDQQRADERIPLLLETPAAVRFISAEPLLGPIRLDHMDAEMAGHEGMYWINSLTGRNSDMGRPCRDVACLDWVIAGAESGPSARPMNEDWVRSLRDQCAEARVAFFLKQVIRDGKKAELPELDGRRHAEWPTKDTEGVPC